MMKSVFSILLWGIFSFSLLAQDEGVVGDSIPSISGDTIIFLSDFPENTPQNNFKNSTNSRVFQMAKVPVPLFILSGISYSFEQYVYKARNHHIPEFRYHYDNHLQYAPAILTFGLKVAGVEGYSDWGRLLTSTSISTATTFILVGGLKYTIGKERPDGSAKNSFPSGHTAIAFLTATWLHKEYGLTRSPLYSIAGYTAATLTGLTRQLNNRHWLSDVFFGAGTGYLAAEIGYWVGDLIFKDKGIIAPHKKRDLVNLKESKPSFIGLNMGYVISNEIDQGNEFAFENRGGYGIAAEGAWFINPYIGFGGKLSSNTNSFALNTKRYYEYHPEDQDYIKNMDNNLIGTNSFNAGAYFALPLSNRFSLGSKFLGGITYTSSSKLAFEIYPTEEYLEGRQITYLNADSDMNWSVGTGLSATILLNRNLGVRFFTDYLFSKAKITFKKNQDVNAETPIYRKNESNKVNTQNLVMGLSVNAYFF